MSQDTILFGNFIIAIEYFIIPRWDDADVQEFKIAKTPTRRRVLGNLPGKNTIDVHNVTIFNKKCNFNSTMVEIPYAAVLAVKSHIDDVISKTPDYSSVTLKQSLDDSK